MLPLIAMMAACQSAPAPVDPRPVVPADDPSWAALGAFAERPADVGAAGWPEVRGRTLHVVTALARVSAQSDALAGDLPGCAARYREGAARIDTLTAAGVDPEAADTAPMLRDALLRGAATCAAFADGPTTAAPASDTGIPALRARWYATARAFADGKDVHAELATLEKDARAAAASLEGALRLEDPTGRRTALAAHLDALDPLFPSEPWGPADGRAPSLAAASIADAAAALLPLAPGSPAPRALPADRAAPDALPEPLLLPGRLAARASPRPLDAESIGAVPSGDALVDVAGWPLPRPDARLQRMGLDDRAHRAWLDVQAQGLSTFPETEVPQAIGGMVERFDRLGHGSRWFNIVALRAGVTSTLASKGAWREARKVLRADEEARTLDATVPACAAARWTVDAQLALLASIDARASLEAAHAAMDAFLAHLDARAGASAAPR